MKNPILWALICFIPLSVMAEPISIQVLEFKTDDPNAWQGFNRKSDSAPLTLKELEKLAEAGIAEQTVVEMMRTRKVLALANADTLLRLKKAGATDAMVAALSAYAYPPNTGFNLALRLNLASPDTLSRAPYLYVEVWHKEKNRQSAFMRADLRRLIQSGGILKVERNRADPLLGETVSRLFVSTKVPTRHPGDLEIRLLTSQEPGLTHLGQLSDVQQKAMKTFAVNYPAVSLEHRCLVDLTLVRDALIKEIFKFESSRLDCRWD